MEVEILGKITRVNCPTGQEDSLVRAAQELDSRLREMADRTKVTNEVKLLTIAALNICYELQQYKEDATQSQEQFSHRVEQLSRSLEECLGKLPSKQAEATA